jgi:hypothetical protein
VQAVVLIPAFDRPEMVWLCLDHLAQCPEVRDVEIRVCIDRRADHAPLSEFARVVEAHADLDIELRFTPPHAHPGNSFNVLSSCRDAWRAGFGRIYLVEDDVMVSPEFFAWHERVHAEAQPSASVGIANPGHGAYASLGVCLPAWAVGEIMEHAVRAYFRNMRGYCQFAFPPSPFDCEQDGLIARVLAGCVVAWADPPIVSHVGWYGYHRRQTRRPTGTLEERYGYVRQKVDDGLPGNVAADVFLANTPNSGTYTLSTVPGGAA